MWASMERMVKPVWGGEVLDEAVLELEEFASAVGGFAECDDASVTDDFIQWLNQRSRGRLRRSGSGGVATEPVDGGLIVRLRDSACGEDKSAKSRQQRAYRTAERGHIYTRNYRDVQANQL